MEEINWFKKDLLNAKNITEIEKLFLKFSNILMNNYQIKINDKLFELTEIEFYYLNLNNHHDTYTHSNEKQKKELELYVHKQPWMRGGIDLTFGNEDFYGGILIRGIKHNENYYSGPAKSKQAIVTNSYIKADSNYKLLQKYLDKKTNWSIIDKEQTFSSIFHSTRVGLGKGNLDFKNALYRFIRGDYLENAIRLKEKTKAKAISNLTLKYPTGAKNAIVEVKNNSLLMNHINLFNQL